MKRLTLFGKKVVLVLASFLFAFVVAEFVLRMYRPIYDVAPLESFEYDHELSYRLRPAAHLLRTTDHQQESRVNGIGTANFQENFEGYERPVFAVGDSYTQGIGVGADQSYPFQLDLTLNRDAEGFYAKGFAVVNLGVGGYGGEQNLIALHRATHRFGAPAVILYLGCDNDFEDDLLFRGGHRHRSWDFAPLRWLRNETQIGIRMKRFLGSRRRAALRQAARAGAGGSERTVAELERPVLDRLAAYAREHNALLVVSWSDLSLSYERMKTWADEQGIAFADWQPRTKSVIVAMPALPLDNQHSGAHHRAWTNRIIADEFARQIKLRVTLPPAS